jgi:hypothetical protein
MSVLSYVIGRHASFPSRGYERKNLAGFKKSALEEKYGGGGGVGIIDRSPRGD